MREIIIKHIAIHSVFLFMIAFSAQAQVGFNLQNTSDMQIGNLPDTKPDNLLAGYNQLNGNIFYKDIVFGFRGEFFNSESAADGFSNVNLSQKHLGFNYKQFEVTAGNFYGILGRGLTFRSFDLPGVINEDLSFRRRYALARDTEGVWVKGVFDKFEVKALHGKPLLNENPPGNDDISRRNDEITGGEINTSIIPYLNIGATYVSVNRAEIDLSSAFLSADLSTLAAKIGSDASFWDIYGEFAVVNGNAGDIVSLSKSQPYAAYLATNILHGPIGISAEYKDYRDFSFRTNDPPSLIKEHSWVLLNRSTHVLRAAGEEGYQLELFYQSTGNTSVIVNHSRSDVDGFFGKMRYDDYYGELFYKANDRYSIKTFVEIGKDEVQQDKDRYTFGGYIDYTLSALKNVRLTYERQNATRLFVEQNAEYTDMFAGFTFYIAPKFSFAVIAERSTDFLETDDASTPDETELDPVYWIGVSAGYKFTDRYEANLFAGKRRGGPACTAGTCYEQLPFRGFELRLSIRM